MFFPSLNTLRNFRVDQVIINKLDAWLAYQPPSKYHHLNPLQFALESNIREDLSVRVFALCSSGELKIMSPKYRLICPGCGEFDRSVADIQSLEGLLLECDCGEIYSPYEFLGFVEIFFELVIDPEFDPGSIIELTEEAKAVLGKSESLRVSALDEETKALLFFDLYEDAAG